MGDCRRIWDRLVQVTELRVASNPSLSGRLPLSLANLSLKTLHYTGTGLCPPAETTFRNWLNTVASHDGTGAECAPPSDREVLELLYEEPATRTLATALESVPAFASRKSVPASGLESLPAFGELKLLRPSFDDSRFTDRAKVADLHVRLRRSRAPVPAGLAVPPACDRAIPPCTSVDAAPRPAPLPR